MIYVYEDSLGFADLFNTKNGTYIRGELLDHTDPFMRSYPELIDVGIMGHCVHNSVCAAANVECYQNGRFATKKNMALKDYCRIVDESKGRTFQIALGGCGDPDMHENFKEVLQYTAENGIVPNFTTSGYGMTPEKAELCKKYCGAVAVSMYSRLRNDFVAIRKDSERMHHYDNVESLPVMFTLGGDNPHCCWDAPNYIIDGKTYDWDEVHHVLFGVNTPYEVIRVYDESILEDNRTMRAIRMLVNAGVTTNIHFVLNTKTIEEAIIRLKYGGFPEGIHAVIFLLHKPVGLGTEEKVLSFDDPRLKEFMDLVNNHSYDFKIGFDSCSVPGLLHMGSSIDPQSMDSCEGARFSMYISSDMKAMPCSFDVQRKWAYDLDGHSIEEAWFSETFEQFRNQFRMACPNCPKRKGCYGGCPICPEITLCPQQEKKRPMPKECFILSSEKIEQIVQDYLTRVLGEEVACKTAFDEDFVCVRLKNRMTNDDLRKVCDSLRDQSEDYFASSASIDTSDIPDLDQKLVYAIIKQELNLTKRHFLVLYENHLLLFTI